MRRLASLLALLAGFLAGGDACASLPRPERDARVAAVFGAERHAPNALPAPSVLGERRYVLRNVDFEWALINAGSPGGLGGRPNNNLYAAFGGNPASFTDPMGTYTAKELNEAGILKQIWYSLPGQCLQTGPGGPCVDSDTHQGQQFVDAVKNGWTPFATGAAKTDLKIAAEFGVYGRVAGAAGELYLPLGEAIGGRAGWIAWSAATNGTAALTVHAAGEAAFDQRVVPLDEGARVSAWGAGLGVPLEAGGSMISQYLAPSEQLWVYTAPYGEMAGRLPPGVQANHLNQDAAFGSIIPKDQGVAVPLAGNAITEIGSEHYAFHESLEGFWSPYRRGGSLFTFRPTNAEYGQAIYSALRAAGRSPEEAAALTQAAEADLATNGLAPTDPVPNIPGRMGQKKP